MAAKAKTPVKKTAAKAVASKSKTKTAPKAKAKAPVKSAKPVAKKKKAA